MSSPSPKHLAKTAFDAASHREAKAEWMQEIAPFAILTTDAELRINSWNHWLTVHSGLTDAEVLGRPLFEVFPDLITRRLDEYFFRALSGEISVLSTALHRYLLPLTSTVKSSGEKFMLQTARVAPLHSGARVLGTITIIEDVTQREYQANLLRRQHSRDQLLSWALGHLLQSSDPLKEVTALFPRVANELNLETYFHYILRPNGTELELHASSLDAEEAEKNRVLPVGSGITGMAAKLRAPVLINNVQQSTEPHASIAKSMGARACASFPLMVGERLLGTVTFLTQSRDVIAPVEVEFLSTLAQYVAVAIDRDSREKTLREAQASLREHAESLEEKIAIRTERLHDTISQLESFSYSVAHDLRAPIRALKGYCEILLEDFSNALSSQGKDVAEKLLRACDRLDTLTRDLLKFSKLSLQPVELTIIPLNRLVADIVLLTPALGENVLVVHGPLGRVWAQHTLLQQCLSNLFDNSLKFVRANQAPRIVVHSEIITTHSEAKPDFRSNAPFNPATAVNHGTEPANGHKQVNDSGERRLRIWIEDNGIGIPPEYHQKIFGIFERVAGPNAPEGTGIGLAIVARAMQRMGGTCGVESALGGGSRFWLELRAAD